MEKEVGSQAFNSIIEAICEKAELKESKELTSLKRKLEELENEVQVLRESRLNRFERKYHKTEWAVYRPDCYVCQFCKLLTIETGTVLHPCCSYCGRLICKRHYEKKGVTDATMCESCQIKTCSF